MIKYNFNILSKLSKAVLIFFLIASTIWACKKDSTNFSSAVESSSNFSVQEAKSWYEFSKSANSTESGIKISANDQSKFSIKNIDWSTAIITADSNYYVVESKVRFNHSLGFEIHPMGDASSSNINGASRLLFLKSKPNNIISSVFMHIYSKNPVNFDDVHYRNVPAGFSGNIFYTSISGEFIKGYTYDDGKIIGETVSPKSTTTTGLKINLLPGGGGSDGDGCVSNDVYVYNQDCDYIVYPDGLEVLQGCGPWTYEYTLHFPPTCPNGGGSGGGGGGGGVPVNPNPSDQDVINQVKNACLHEMTDIALAQDIEGSIGAAIHNIYGTPAFPHLIISDTKLGLTRDANTTTTYFTNGELISSIQLNNSTLPKSSTEFIAATIMHEFGHAIINAGHVPSSDAAGEEQLAIQFVNTMASSLQTSYGLTSDQAYALAWGGLEQTPAFASQVGVGSTKAATYKTINDSYRDGTSGSKPCSSGGGTVQ